jgi:hypothetical protein
MGALEEVVESQILQKLIYDVSLAFIIGVLKPKASLSHHQVLFY